MLSVVAIIALFAGANSFYLGGYGGGCGGYGGYAGYGYGNFGHGYGGRGYAYGLGFAGIGHPAVAADITTTGLAYANDAAQHARTAQVNAATRSANNLRADHTIAAINRQSAINAQAAATHAFTANSAYAARTHKIGQAQAIANRGIQMSRNYADGARINHGALGAAAQANHVAAGNLAGGSANMATVASLNHGAHANAMGYQANVFARGAASAHGSPFGGYGGYGGAGWGYAAPGAFNCGINGCGPRGINAFAGAGGWFRGGY